MYNQKYRVLILLHIPRELQLVQELSTDISLTEFIQLADDQWGEWIKIQFHHSILLGVLPVNGALRNVYVKIYTADSAIGSHTKGRIFRSFYYLGITLTYKSN